MEPTLGQRMSRQERRNLSDQVAEYHYKGGRLYAPVHFKADGDGPDPLAALEFDGLANTGHPDWGRDIVRPEAFTKATLAEFLKYGRQLLHMHNPAEQIGEITGAEVIPAGKRSTGGNRAGGLFVQGFVDSPYNSLGVIPDHPLAKVIEFARMQVEKGRLKAMSVGWMPVQTRMVKARDPRTGEDATFREIQKLLLREVSLVTFAMNPQSLAELRKGYADTYGDEVADALFCTDAESCGRIPEKVDDFTFDRIRDIAFSSAVNAARNIQPKGADPDDTEQSENGRPGHQLKLVRLDDEPKRTLKLVSLSGGTDR